MLDYIILSLHYWAPFHKGVRTSNTPNKPVMTCSLSYMHCCSTFCHHGTVCHPRGDKLCSHYTILTWISIPYIYIYILCVCVCARERQREDAAAPHTHLVSCFIVLRSVRNAAPCNLSLVRLNFVVGTACSFITHVAAKRCQPRLVSVRCAFLRPPERG